MFNHHHANFNILFLYEKCGWLHFWCCVHCTGRATHRVIGIFPNSNKYLLCQSPVIHNTVIFIYPQTLCCCFLFMFMYWQFLNLLSLHLAFSIQRKSQNIRQFRPRICISVFSVLWAANFILIYWSYSKNNDDKSK